jgi:hypothetical protein
MTMSTVSLGAPDESLRAASPRRTGLWIGAALVIAGPLIGLTSTLVGMAVSDHTIESVYAPTPNDLATGVHISMFGTVAGLVIGAVGLGFLAWTLIQSLRSQSLG